ncbi:hypothetical protein GCM10028791_28570 [Echinicola sediminis]
MKNFIVVILIFLSVGGFSQSTNYSNSWNRTELFFGSSISSGGKVSKRKWKKFVANYVTPEFPEGFTVIQANGKWQDAVSKQTISEKSRVILLVYPETEKQEADNSLEKISQTYIELFDQQSVLRVDSKSNVIFYPQ